MQGIGIGRNKEAAENMFDFLEIVRRSNVIYQQRQRGALDHTDAEAIFFLNLIGYWNTDGDETGDAEENSFRRSSLEFASRLSSLFTIDRPLNDTPQLVGGTAIPSGIDPSLKRNNPLSSGGRGIGLQPAFEGCIVEMVERIASLARPSEVDRPVPAARISDGARLFLPGDIVFASDNIGGVASARSHAAAVAAALLECAERYSVTKWWGEQLALPQPPETFTELMSEVFRLAPWRKRWLLDLSDVTGVPVIGALSSTENDQAIIMGAGAGLTLEEAAGKAVTELYQMEHAAAISAWKCANLPAKNVKQGDRVWQSRLDTHSIASFPAFSPTGKVLHSKRPTLARAEIAQILSSKLGDGYIIKRKSAIEQISTAKILFPAFSVKSLARGPSPRPI